MQHRLIIKGDKKELEIIIQKLRARVKVKNLSVSLEEIQQEGKIPLVVKSDDKKSEDNLTAKQVADKISNCKTISELEVYKDDKRQIVKAAYNKKFKELE